MHIFVTVSTVNMHAREIGYEGNSISSLFYTKVNKQDNNS